MRNYKWMIVLLCVLLTCSGCQLIRVNPERDGSRVVATVNGEEIHKVQVYSYLGIGWDTTVESWEEESLQQQKESALDALIQQTLLNQKSREYGFDQLTAEDEAAIEADYAEYIASIYDSALESFRAAAEEAEATGEETEVTMTPEEQADEYVDLYLSLFGMNREVLKDDLRQEYISEKLRTMVYDTVVVNDEEVKSEWTTQAYSQASTFTTVDAVIQAEMDGTLILYYPTDMLRVEQILLMFDQTTIEEIANKRAAGDDDAADALRDAAAEKLAEELKEVQDALAAGEEWAALRDAHDDDGGNDYLVAAGTTMYVNEFTNAAVALKTEGQTSDAVLSDYGYHIIRLAKKHAAGLVEFEQVQVEMRDSLLSTRQSTAWSEAWAKWVEAAEVKTYPNRLK